MNIRHNQENQKGKLTAHLDTKLLGYISYSMSDTDTIVIEHTFVKEEFRGKDVGENLVKAVVKYARDANLLIDPKCPFAAAEFRRNPEYQEVMIK